MAAENEATCESDPNFAVICGFLEKFGVTCGLTNIDFLDLQKMLENTHEGTSTRLLINNRRILKLKQLLFTFLSKE